jgi:hypothetical protein
LLGTAGAGLRLADFPAMPADVACFLLSAISIPERRPQLLIRSRYVTSVGYQQLLTAEISENGRWNRSRKSPRRTLA